MDVKRSSESAIAGIAAAIADPARAKMLYGLMDGRARTSTELSVIANVAPSTASAHLSRLRQAELLSVVAQGRHRYYALASGAVATVLESLNVLAGAPSAFAPTTPPHLRRARTCYDHLAGSVGVRLNDQFLILGWLRPSDGVEAGDYDLTPKGRQAFADLTLELNVLRSQRRRFACACLDWSERRPHLGGALGAAVLKLALQRSWLVQDLDGRGLETTSLGARAFARHFNLVLADRDL